MGIKRIVLITILLILLMFLQTTISNAAEISSRQFEIDEKSKTISKIPMGTTVEEVKRYIASEEEIKIFSKEGYEVENSHEITTGMVLKAGEEEYSLVITGDTSGDGKRTVVDIAQVKMHLVDIRLLNGVYLKAADTNYDNVVNVVDLSRLKLIVLGLLDIDSNLKVEEIKVTTPETGTYKAGEKVTIEIKWSEEITVNESPELIIKFGDGELRKATYKQVNEDTMIYEYEITEGDNGELNIISYTGGNITDGINNGIAEIKELTGNRITADTNAPTVTIGSPSKTVVKSGQTVTYTITLSETATLDSSKITVTGTGSTGCKIQVTGSGRNYTATVTGGTGNGAVTLNIAAGAFTDSAGNTNATTNKTGLTIDNTVPTVTVGSPSKTVVKSGQTATYTITLSEAATLDSSKITVTGAGSTGCKIQVTGSGRNYTATVTGGTGNGAVTLNIAVGAFTDNAGNTNSTTTKTGLTIDNTAPLSFNITAKLGSENNSVIVSGETTDEHSGISGYKYSSDNGTNWTEQTTQTTHTFNNLTVGNTYYFKMKAIDNVGNETESNTATVTIPLPVPEGYVASEVEGENTIEDGLVIYEGTEPVTEENHETALTTRNQYVWIPVDDINDMVMCSSNTGDSVCDLKHDKVADTLTCQTHPETAINLVGRLYTSSRTGSNPYSYTMDFTKRDQTYDESSYHEPAVITGTAGTDGTSYDGSSTNLEIAGMPAGSTAQQFLTQLQSDFTVMAKSVAKNGGFYISRYEVGEGGSSKKGQPVLTASSRDGSNYLGANMWYGLYNTIRKIDANKQMIWGCQYDQVIKFLKENGEDPENGHRDRNLTTNHALSGQNEQDCMNNIYDLEGNHSEWTAEANSTGTRARRGSYCFYANLGYFYPASSRNYSYPTVSHYSFSSRTTLYL